MERICGDDKLTHSSFYAYMIHMHPSGFEAKGDLTSDDNDKEYPNKYRTIHDHKKLFNNNNLFEVVVMYLFNGLKTQINTHMQPSHPDIPTRNGSTNLIHYLAYMVPEFDKVYIVDFDAHPNHHDRLRHIRVIFDQHDYRFRVIMNAHFKNQEGQEGWSDVSEALRAKFAEVSANVAKTSERNLEKIWTRLVKEFRIVLIANIVEFLKLGEKDRHLGWNRVTGWVMAPEDISWETTKYGLNSFLGSDWLDHLKGSTHYEESVGAEQQKEIEENPFVMSYWADNYLELDSYKVARMFSGLVGYGEYVYNRTNNYTKHKTNNLYWDLGSGQTWWIWHDLPQYKGSNDKVFQLPDPGMLPPNTVGVPYNRYQGPRVSKVNSIPAKETIPTSNSISHTTKPVDHIEFCYSARKFLLQCVVWHSYFYVSDPFLLLVQRRHERVRDAVFAEALHALLDYAQLLLDEEVGNFMVFENKPVEETPDTVFPKVTLEKKLYNMLVASWYEKDTIIYQSPAGIIAQIDTNWMDSNIHKIIEEMGEDLKNMKEVFENTKSLFDSKDEDRTEYQNVQKKLRSTFGTVIHMSREKWLLDKHTKNIKFLDLTCIQITKPIKWEERNPRRKGSHSSFNTSKNNSDLCQVYRDRAVGTYSPGYLDAAQRADLVCPRYQCKLRSQILQGYYDRKMNRNSAMTKFVETQDLTSIFRSTQSLVRGLREFTKRIASQKDNSLAQIQPSRTDYSPHGKYWVLGAKHGVHGTRVVGSKHTDGTTTEEGMRDIHCDDVVMFSSILSEVIDNPGMWNLVTTKTLSTTKTDSGGNEEKEEKDCLQVANSGFVIHGQKILDEDVSSTHQGSGNDDTKSTDSLSWYDIFQMTYEKLRVGIMDQPTTPNTSRYYQNEVINSTRRLSVRNAHEGFAFCMKKIYNSDEFAELLLDISASTKPLKKNIQKNTTKFVEELLRNCKDAGLQLHSPDDPDYAFPQLKRYNIILEDTEDEDEDEDVEDMDLVENFHTDPAYNENNVTKVRGHKRLFYILFGELMFSMINDLEETPMANNNSPQDIQKKTNDDIAKYYKDQMLMFLARLTTNFFACTLHHSLAVQLKNNNLLPYTGHRLSPEQPEEGEPLPLRTDYKSIVHHIEEVCARAHLNRVNNHILRELPLQSHQQDIQIQVQKHVINLVASMYKYGDETPLTPHEYRAFQRCFSPHIEVYKKLQIFKESGEEYRKNGQKASVTSPELANNPGVNEEHGAPSVSGTTEKSEEQKRVTFCENRMLAMRICEEQMHIMERGHGTDREFHQSFAWKILMYMFMEMRQFFAHVRFIEAFPLNVHAVSWPNTDQKQR